MSRLDYSSCFVPGQDANGYGWVGVIVLEGFENVQIEPLGHSSHEQNWSSGNYYERDVGT